MQPWDKDTASTSGYVSCLDYLARFYIQYVLIDFLSFQPAWLMDILPRNNGKHNQTHLESTKLGKTVFVCNEANFESHTGYS